MRDHAQSGEGACCDCRVLNPVPTCCGAFVFLRSLSPCCFLPFVLACLLRVRTSCWTFIMTHGPHSSRFSQNKSYPLHHPPQKKTSSFLHLYLDFINLFYPLTPGDLWWNPFFHGTLTFLICAFRATLSRNDVVSSYPQFHDVWLFHLSSSFHDDPHQLHPVTIHALHHVRQGQSAELSESMPRASRRC